MRFLKSVKCGHSPKHFWDILRCFFPFFWCPLNIYHATLLLSSKNHIIFHHNALTFHHKTSYDSSTTSRSAAYHTTNWWDVEFETQVQVLVHQSSSLSIMFISNDSTYLKPSMNWLAIEKFHLATAWISVGTPIYGNPSAPAPWFPQQNHLVKPAEKQKKQTKR